MTILSITPLGSQCFTVADSTPANHHVDLREYARNGSCTCNVFMSCCRHLLKLQKVDKAWRCDHILAARDFAFETEFWALVDRSEKIIELTTNELSGIDHLPLGR